MSTRTSSLKLLSVFLALILGLLLLFTSPIPKQTSATTLKGSPAGDAGDTDGTTFKFREDNEGIYLTNSTEDALLQNEISALYAGINGVTIYDNGVDVTSPSYNGPGGPKTPIGMDLSDAAGWPNISVPPGKVAVDPTLGRIKFSRYVQKIGFLDLNKWGSIVLAKMFGERLYIESKKEGKASLLIVDVSSLTKPVIVGAYTYPSTSEFTDLFVTGNYVYLNNGDIFDVATSTPMLVSTYGQSKEIEGSGNYIYVIEQSGHRLDILDISNRTHPLKVGSYDASMYPGNIVSMSISGNYAYTIRDFYVRGSRSDLFYTNLDVVDISNVSSPILVGDYGFSRQNVLDFRVAGSKAYLTANDGSWWPGYSPVHTTVFDVSDPGNPVKISNFTSGYALGSGYAIHIGGNYFYIGSRNTIGHASLQITDISNVVETKGVDNLTIYGGGAVHLLTNKHTFTSNRGWLDIYEFSLPESPKGPVTVDFSYAASGGPGKLDRLWGMSSFATANSISQYGWLDGSSKAVVVARDDWFTDALAGAPLANKVKDKFGNPSPLLLTNSHFLPSKTKDEIKRLGAEKIYVLGGTGAIDDNVFKELLNIEGVTEVKRLWAERSYGTAEAIKREIDNIAKENGTAVPDTAIITTGENFPDALAISGAASASKMPILLVKPFTKEPEPETKAALQGISKVIIVGGPGVVHPDLESWLRRNGFEVIKRLWGQTEYDTAVDIASSGFELFGFDRSTVFVSRGDYFTDGLTAGAYASKLGPSPVVLVKPESVPEITRLLLEGYNSDFKKIHLLGGYGAISDGVKHKVEQIVGP